MLSCTEEWEFHALASTIAGKLMTTSGNALDVSTIIRDHHNRFLITHDCFTDAGYGRTMPKYVARFFQ